MARGAGDGKPVFVRNFAVIAIVDHEKWSHHTVHERLRSQPLECDADTIDDPLFREWQDLIWQPERRKPLFEEIVFARGRPDQHCSFDSETDRDGKRCSCTTHGVTHDRAHRSDTFSHALDGAGEARDREPGSGRVAVTGRIKRDYGGATG